MATLIPQQITSDGGLEVATVDAASGGDEAPCGDNRILYVRNTGVGTPTVTVTTPATVGGLTIEDVVQVMDAGGVWVLPLENVFASTTGRATVTYSAATDLDVAVLELA